MIWKYMTVADRSSPLLGVVPQGSQIQNFVHLTMNVSETVSHIVTCQSLPNISSTTSLWKCKSWSSTPPPPRGVPVHYKQKYVGFFDYFWNIICDECEIHCCIAEQHLCIILLLLIKMNTIGCIPSKCWRHVTSSSDGPDTRRQLCIFPTPPAFDAAFNCNSFE